MAVSPSMFGAVMRGGRRRERDFDPNVGGGVDRDKLPAGSFAGPDRSFPIDKPGDVSDAASSLGRTKHARGPIKANIIRIAHAKGASFVSQLPKAWRTKEALSLAESYLSAREMLKEDWAAYDASKGSSSAKGTSPANFKTMSDKAEKATDKQLRKDAGKIKRGKKVATVPLSNIQKAKEARAPERRGFRLLEGFRTTTRLHEARIQDTDQGPRASVLIIREGPGNPSDRHYYSKQALETSVAEDMWNGKPCFIDHPTTVEDKIIPERLVEKQCGYFENARLTTVLNEAGQKVTGIIADLVPETGNELALRKLRTTAQYSEQFPRSSYLGFSINAEGVGGTEKIGDREWNRVDQITGVTSVDIVTKAGAGGKLLSFREAYRMATRSKDVEFSEAHLLKLREALSEAGVKLTPSQDDEVDRKLGVVDGSPIDKVLDKVTGVPPDEDDDDDDDDQEQESRKREARKKDDDEESRRREARKDDDDEESRRERRREAAGCKHDDDEECSKCEEGASKRREARKDDDDDEESRREAREARGRSREDDVMMEVGLKEMSRRQLEAFVERTVKEANHAKREAAKTMTEAQSIKESAKREKRRVEEILRERTARQLMEKRGVPKDHRARVLREVMRDCQDSYEIDDRIKEYMKLEFGGLRTGVGTMLRESGGTGQKLQLECVKPSGF
jgi:hypothetical protein